MLERYISLAIGLCAVLLAVEGAQGHDLVVPPWRGQEGTTFQHWTFDDNDNPASPESIDNPYGDALATINLGQFASGWLSQLPGFGTQTGYWDLGASGGQISIELDNRPELTVRKEVWVQVTSFVDIHQAPTVDVAGADFVRDETVTVEVVPTGGTWYLYQSVWQLEPSASTVQIVISSDATWSSIVDQVVVDTNAITCIVDEDDLWNLSAAWLEQGPGLEADLVGDPIVNLEDFAYLASYWLEPCPPGWPWP